MTSRYFAAFCLAAPEKALPVTFFPGKLGFTVPRAIGKAVIRNRVKRRMRAAVRQNLTAVPGRCAIVFNPRRNVVEAPFSELCREVGRILAKCHEL